MPEKPLKASRRLSLKVLELARDKKGLDLRLLEVGKISIVADYFLLITGTNVIQVKSIADHITLSLKKEGLLPLRVEGYREGWWIIIDYGTLVVHVFQPEAREFYNLERLWADAPLLEESFEKGADTADPAPAPPKGSAS